MSAGYAQRLSKYPNKGICGLPECYDSKRALAYKLDKLVQLLQLSRHTVVLTGAGISTSAGIPDFRGPSGIWTKEMLDGKSKKKKMTKMIKKQSLTDCTGSKLARVISSTNDTNTNVVTNTLAPLENKITNGRRKRKQDDDDEGHKNGTKPNQQPKSVISFETARPTYTHWALAHMMLHPTPLTSSIAEDDDGDDNESSRNVVRTTTSANIDAKIQYPPPPPPLQYLVTQNVDGLHRKTNIPRNQMSILHGCIFTEVCDTCHTEHIRDFEIQSIGLNYTGRDCTLGGSADGGGGGGLSCPGKLKDTLLDWEDDLPELDWDRAETECRKADLILCLGTSLRIEPAASLCTYPNTDNNNDGNKKKKKQHEQPSLGYVIVNLQPTPYDDGAALVIRAKVDDVMRGVMEKLGYGEEDWKE